jgi:hypothetical protein
MQPPPQPVTRKVSVHWWLRRRAPRREPPVAIGDGRVPVAIDKSRKRVAVGNL